MWILIALVILYKTYSTRLKERKNALIASFSFIIFGISDFIEMQTGAWYKPTSLLITKAACVITFAFCLRSYLKTKSRLKRDA